MIKKLVALAATALFSMTASAGYTQYNLTGDKISGYFIQNDVDQSIAAYGFAVEPQGYHFDFKPTPGYAYLLRATTRFIDEGPTNFAVFETATGGYTTDARLTFNRPSSPGVYDFSGRFAAVDDITMPGNFRTIILRFNGTATVAPVPSGVAENLDFYLAVRGEYPDGVRRIVPFLVEVPEPTSIALFALGVAGIAGASHRRKALK